MALPLFCKVSANRREYKTNVFVFILEVPPNDGSYVFSNVLTAVNRVVYGRQQLVLRPWATMFTAVNLSAHGRQPTTKHNL